MSLRKKKKNKIIIKSNMIKHLKTNQLKHVQKIINKRKKQNDSNHFQNSRASSLSQAPPLQRDTTTIITNRNREMYN